MTILRNRRRYQSALVILLTITVQTVFAQMPRVETGIDVLEHEQFAPLKGKRVGLITNPTGVNARLRSTVDLLYNAPGVKLVALFGPEHGVRGDVAAGQHVGDQTDPVTGVPVYSLYGANRKPTPQMLKGIDVLVYDIQDIGTRSYTYISTMGLAMEAAAENNIPFMVLDRPDPLGGNKVEGLPVQKGFTSFVSQFPIPYVYGLTSGELARFLNGEGLLDSGKQCRLTVIPMKGWHRDMTFAQTGLSWVPTSPHIPDENTPLYYVATGVMGELGVLSEGVGYTLPFKVMGAEWMDAHAMATRMNALNLPGVRFRPITWNPFYGRDKGKTLHGVQIVITEAAKADLLAIQFYFMQVNHELYPDKDPFAMASKDRLHFFDLVAGTDSVRLEFHKHFRYSDVKPLLDRGLSAFRKEAGKYYLYQ